MNKEELYMEFYKDLSEKQQQMIRKILDKAEDLQQRIDKAVEYIDEKTKAFINFTKIRSSLTTSQVEELLSILKGENNE